MNKINISLLDIQKAQKKILPFVKKTTLKKSPFLSQQLGIPLFLKWETEQKIKSFKLRGALNKILSLSDQEKKRGLIASSAGNHAQGVSLAAHYAQTKARVVMMETASKVKVKAAKKLGAEVILKGRTYDECYEHALSIQGDSVFIHPFFDSLIVAGQATVGLEILEQNPNISSCVFAIGGGGLISGSAFAIKQIKPSCKVYGVVWQGTPSFCKDYHQKKDACLCGVSNNTDQNFKIGLTDGIAVKKQEPKMLEFARDYIDDVGCVTDQDIEQTMVNLWKHEKQKVEGSGAAALAGIFKYKKKWDLGTQACVIISGGNVDDLILSDLMKKYGKDH